MPVPPDDHTLQQVGDRPTIWEMVTELERLSSKFRINSREAQSELGRQRTDLDGYRPLIRGSKSCIETSWRLLASLEAPR